MANYKKMSPRFVIFVMADMDVYMLGSSLSFLQCVAFASYIYNPNS